MGSWRKPGSGREAIGRYWLLLFLLSVATTIVCTALAGGNFTMGIIGALLLLPGVQLVCSLLIAASVNFFDAENAAAKSECWRAIGKLTVWSALGAVVGILVMMFISAMD